LEDFSAGGLGVGAFVSALGFESLDAGVFDADSPLAAASVPPADLLASLDGGEDACGFLPSFP
jgi:hypothetical protein